MRAFMDDDFLLGGETAKQLYHQVAKDLPIFDFHCHLSPQEIYDNITFRNIGHLMLGGDHYKWRLMLANGVDEANIRGNGSDWEKFYAFAATLKYAIGNPVYQWTHLELRRVFGIEEILSEKTAKAIWDKANALLATDEYRCRGLIQRFGVKAVVTTDSPCDDLRFHKLLAKDDSFRVKVLPAFRPDQLINIDRGGFVDAVQLLGRVSGRETFNFDDMLSALESRVAYFHACGARISDHALDRVPYAVPSYTVARETYRKALCGEPLDRNSIETYKTCLLHALGKMYHARGWTMQYHIGALRNANPRMFQRVGPDSGFDAIHDDQVSEKLSRLLGVLDQENCLPKTILYNLNPKDTTALGVMTGCFQGGMAGKVQLGSAWWFLDTRDGMAEQMRVLGNTGLLGRFVGMVTDSRSFTAYARHELFRRVLCDLIGGWVDAGEYPADPDTLAELVRGICFDNAAAYFGIAL